MKNTKCPFAILLFIFVFCGFVSAQMTLTFSADTNHICDGNGCDYFGPSILINEVMLTPASHDGSIYGTGPGFNPGDNEGEWIELYNPDLCKPIDISCYFLGNNTNEANQGLYDLGAGFAIPQGTIVPARGFVLLRGIYAPPVPSNLLVQNGGNTVEIVVNDISRICLGGGYRLWFPNAGGWFAFYDNNGIPQDAISWNSTTNSYLYANPCNPTTSACQFTGTLSSYDNIPAANKTYITNTDPGLTPGQSFRRMPDGGAWTLNTPANPTYATCNDICVPPAVITCDGQATVMVSGGTPPYSYIWNDPQTSNTATATGLCAGYYSVTVTDSNNVQQIDSVNIVDFIPGVTFNNLPAICIDANPFNLTSYVSPAGGTFSGTGVTGTNFNPATAGIGTHTISYVYADTNTCKDSVIQTITVKPLPVATSNITHVLCNGGNTGQVNLTVSGGDPPYTYLWNTAPPQTSANANNLVAGNYTVTITDSNGCDITYTYTVTEPSAITINLTPIDEKCENSCDGQITSTVTGGTGPSYTYLWSNGQTTPNDTGLCAGSYTVTVTDANACTKNDNASVSTTWIISADFTANPVSGTVPLSVDFSFTGSGASTYQWDFGDGGTSSVQNPSYVFDSVGLFTVTLIVNSGNPYLCTDTSTLSIEVIIPSLLVVPNVFTPNGDSYNDEFMMQSQGIKTFICTIYNRWGKKVFEWNDINKGWDGKTEAGKTASDGVYYYILYAKGYDKVEYDQHGTVTLLR